MTLEAPYSEHLLPDNSTTFERSLSAPTQRLAGVPVPLRKLWRPWECPAPLLPWLAWGLSVDTWDAAWTEDQKRRVIAASIPVHRVKGTIGALRRAVTALGFQIRVEEWFEYGGQPYHFRVAVEQGDETISQADLDLIWSVILKTKNVRSFPEPISIRSVPRRAKWWRALALSGHNVAIGPRTPGHQDTFNPVKLFSRTLQTVTVYPQ